MTALAMLHFRKGGAHWGIFEVGLGGRLDATNILRPRWTAITSIGLEHTDKLGNTLALIAAEKAGIIKAGNSARPGQPAARGRSGGRADCPRQSGAGDPGEPRPHPPVRPGMLEVLGPEFAALSGPGPRWRGSRPGAPGGPGAGAPALARRAPAWGREPSRAELIAAMASLKLPARVDSSTATRRR
jgi:hypothetical protein